MISKGKFTKRVTKVNYLEKFEGNMRQCFFEGKLLLAERQQCVPFSFRHRYSYIGNNRQKDDGTYRAPKQIADAMDHSLDIHLASYARFMIKELAKNFDQEKVEVN